MASCGAVACGAYDSTTTTQNTWSYFWGTSANRSFMRNNFTGNRLMCRLMAALVKPAGAEDFSLSSLIRKVQTWPSKVIFSRSKLHGNESSVGHYFYRYARRTHIC